MLRELKSKLAVSQTSWIRQKLSFGKEKQSRVAVLNCATVLSNNNNSHLPIVPIIGATGIVTLLSLVVFYRKSRKMYRPTGDE